MVDLLPKSINSESINAVIKRNMQLFHPNETTARFSKFQQLVAFFFLYA